MGPFRIGHVRLGRGVGTGDPRHIVDARTLCDHREDPGVTLAQPCGFEHAGLGEAPADQ